MSYKIKILPSTFTDMKKAKKWYSDINEELGNDFKSLVDAEIDCIGINPNHYQKRYKEFVLSHIKRFPYSIFYIIDEERKYIVIVGVVHMKKDPEQITKRKIRS